jgi:hypothetical protein
MKFLSEVETDKFNSGYMLRSLYLILKHDSKTDWQHTQDYSSEKDTLSCVNLDNKLFVNR